MIRKKINSEVELSIWDNQYHILLKHCTEKLITNLEFDLYATVLLKCRFYDEVEISIKNRDRKHYDARRN